MGDGIWEREFGEARRGLVESSDVRVLRSRGHDLVDGVVLTSVSDLPFEVSLKCAQCGMVFWFRNIEWVRGRIGKWRVMGAPVSQCKSALFRGAGGCGFQQ
jgi:hypothetical protein